VSGREWARIDPAPSFGMALSSQGGTVHRVRAAYRYSPPLGMPSAIWAVWECRPGTCVEAWHSSARHVQLMDDPGAHLRCAKCGVEDTGNPSLASGRPGWPDIPVSLYVARRVDGVVKVGCTTDVERRMRQLDAELLASRPGNYVDERRLLAGLPLEPVEGQEWFAPGSEAVLLAALNEVAA
jgi:hypothetical protein